MMIVITVGKSYIDIDGYASAIAYRELLNLQGIEAKFVSNATLNYSVTKSLIDIPYSIDKCEINNNDSFIILDLSNKDYFPDFVNEDSIVEIIDHHPGFEEYWKNKIGDKAIIKQIGSIATIVVEKYEQLNLLDQMNKDIARLLMSAILDNTLNFTANITKDRDMVAYHKLEEITHEYNYAEKYFEEVQKSIEENLEESVKNDIKIQYINEYLPDVFGQLTIWNAEELLHKRDFINQIMNGYGNEWMLNIISLSNNSSYIIYSNDEIKSKLEQLLDCYDKNGTLIKSPAMLRKEIMRKALTAKSK